MKINIQKLPKALLLFVLLFMINLIVSKKYPYYYVFYYNNTLEDYEKATSIITILGASSSSFILLGIFILFISLINWGISKKFRWCYSQWMLLIVVLIEIIRFSTFNDYHRI